MVVSEDPRERGGEKHGERGGGDERDLQKLDSSAPGVGKWGGERFRRAEEKMPVLSVQGSSDHTGRSVGSMLRCCCMESVCA